MHGDRSEVDSQILAVAEEITKYLQGREHVADTLEGIARWWVMQQRVYEENRRVERAMEYLHAQGVVEKRNLQDGQTLYRVAAGRDANVNVE